MGRELIVCYSRRGQNLVGERFSEYDSYLVLSHFKGHAMASFGGAIKNISSGLGSKAGKCLIHTGGKKRKAANSPNYKPDSILTRQRAGIVLKNRSSA